MSRRSSIRAFGVLQSGLPQSDRSERSERRELRDCQVATGANAVSGGSLENVVDCPVAVLDLIVFDNGGMGW